jgi:hypothetical protein
MLFPTMRWLALSAMVCSAAVLGGAGLLQAQSEDSGEGGSREYVIKAAYLYQFGRYVQWPANAFPDEKAPLVIGVLGPDPFGNVLEGIARTKKIENRPIMLRRFATMAEYKPCNILFVTSAVSEEERKAAIKKARKSPVLLVGEAPGFAEEGGTINFFLEGNKIRFEINTEVAKQDQLKISSKLLSLAKIVR